MSKRLKTGLIAAATSVALVTGGVTAPAYAAEEVAAVEIAENGLSSDSPLAVIMGAGSSVLSLAFLAMHLATTWNLAVQYGFISAPKVHLN